VNVTANDEQSYTTEFLLACRVIKLVLFNIEMLVSITACTLKPSVCLYVQALESRPAWQGLNLRNKVGISVGVPELQVQ